MILTHKNDPVQSMHQQSMPELQNFWKTVSLREALARCCKNKQQGVTVFNIFYTLFIIVFRQRNFWRWSTGENDIPSFGRDTVYRFLNSPFHNWRGFLRRIALKAIAFLVPLSSGKERKVFVVDDSLYDKNRSKKIELLSRVYDHVEQKFVRGFRMLALAFTDGVSLIPLDFALLGSKKILCEANSNIDRRSHGSKRRSEAVCEAPEVLLSMIDRCRDLIIDGSHIVFDSWFCFPSLIRALAERNLHVIGRLKKNNTRYLFRRSCKESLITLELLYAKLSRIPRSVRECQREGNADILGSFCVALPPVEKEESVPVRIVFLQNKRSKNQQEWLAILTTDLELTEEQIVRMYAKRWNIEEFFKVAKSLLQLEGEFQGRSYDMLIGHATLVYVRYIFLELERRRTLDIRTCGELFYHCCDELSDLKIREAILRIFQALETFLAKFSQDGEKILKTFLEYFTSALPAHILALMPIFGCES
jgi:hypothetical protein